MSRVRVLDLRDTYEVGGPGKTILETFRTIDASRFSLHLGVFVAEGESADTPFLAEARRFGIPTHLIAGYNQYDPRLITRTAALMRKLDIDVLHTHEVKSDVIALLAAGLRRTSLLTTMHGWIGNSSRQRALIALDKRVARHFDCVIAVSNVIREQLLQAGVAADRVRLVHNAIVLERYRRTGARGALEALVGRPLASPVLSCVGRLSAEKGHADLIEAVALVTAGGHRLTLVIAGDGPERARLEQQIQSLGLADCVFLPGYVARPQVVLEESDLMVLPSHTEGLPNAALEALAMGVPVLATRVGGTPEVIIDGQTGRLVAPHAPLEMSSAILNFLTCRPEWSRMAATGREHVERSFTIEARTRKIEDLYAELASVPTC